MNEWMEKRGEDISGRRFFDMGKAGRGKSETRV